MVFLEHLLGNAVRNFQTNFGLVPDGIVSSSTWNALFPYINGRTVYIIKPGDTLYSIASKFDTNISRILFANPGITPNSLQVGQRIIVPFSSIVPTNISYSYEILSLNISALTEIYPFLQTGTIGSSVLGNSIPYIKIGNGDNEVFYSGAIHANEWITAVLLMKFIENFSLAYVNNATIFGYSAREIFEYSSIYIIPMCNPDGVNLVTGAYPQGSSIYLQAQSIASIFPNLSFPDGWKANIEGVDLENLQPVRKAL